MGPSTPSPDDCGRQGFVPLGLPPASPVGGERDDLRRFFRGMMAEPRTWNEFYVALSQTHLCDPSVRAVVRYRLTRVPGGLGHGYYYRYSLVTVRPWKPRSIGGLAILQSSIDCSQALSSDVSMMNEYLNARRDRRCTRAAARIQRAVLFHIYRPGGSMMLRSIRELDLAE